MQRNVGLSAEIRFLKMENIVTASEISFPIAYQLPSKA